MIFVSIETIIILFPTTSLAILEAVDIHVHAHVRSQKGTVHSSLVHSAGGLFLEIKSVSRVGFRGITISGSREVSIEETDSQSGEHVRTEDISRVLGINSIAVISRLARSEQNCLAFVGISITSCQLNDLDVLKSPSSIVTGLGGSSLGIINIKDIDASSSDNSEVGISSDKHSSIFINTITDGAVSSLIIDQSGEGTLLCSSVEVDIQKSLVEDTEATISIESDILAQSAPRILDHQERIVLQDQGTSRRAKDSKVITGNSGLDGGQRGSWDTAGIEAVEHGASVTTVEVDTSHRSDFSVQGG